MDWPFKKVAGCYCYLGYWETPEKSKSLERKCGGQSVDCGGEPKIGGILTASMVTSAYPVPEGFTELEVFSIGTALLVEGKLG